MNIEENIAKIGIPTGWKPKISNKIRIVDLGSNQVLNQTELGYQLSVNKDTLSLLQTLDGTKTVDEIATSISSTGTHINATALRDYFVDYFVKKGFIESDLLLQRRPHVSYLKIKINLVSEYYVNKLDTRWLNWLFNKHFFYPAFIFFFLLHISFIAYYGKNNNVTGASSPLLFLSLLLCHFCHEWAHAVAANKYGVQSGGIGLGLYYYILPVFYIDLSDAWNTSRENRLIINLAGIYTEYLIAAGMYPVYFVTGNTFFLVLPILLFVKSWFNLNPLLRSDMYWVVTDYFNKPNLIESAMLSLKCLLHRGKKIPKKEKKKHLYLALYGIIIIGFWTYIIRGFVIQGLTVVESFPRIFKDLAKMIASGQYKLKTICYSIYNLSFFFFLLFIVSKAMKPMYDKIKKGRRRGKSTFTEHLD